MFWPVPMYLPLLVSAVLALVISRFGIMFFSDPAAAFAKIAAALRPGGRAALLCAAEPEGSG
ncbi:hypothetical protein ACFQ9Z_15875 [Streptomyces sp. NPDC056580]|uniref:hypothetical protein n=1 Tax=Streptomyces sp. NPDC056580 TaxID=3345872 RepID=UPI0036973C06